MKVLPSHWSSASFVFGVIFFYPLSSRDYKEGSGKASGGAAMRVQEGTGGECRERTGSFCSSPSHNFPYYYKRFSFSAREPKCNRSLYRSGTSRNLPECQPMCVQGRGTWGISGISLLLQGASPPSTGELGVQLPQGVQEQPEHFSSSHWAASPMPPSESAGGTSHVVCTETHP